MPEPSNSPVVRAWITKAEGDLRAARLLMEADPPVPDAAAFHCQQAVEKYLKAYLVYLGVDPPRTHDLLLLLDLLTPHDEALEPFRDLAQPLSPLAVQVRYPFAEASEEEAKSQVLDRANHGWKHLAERNATSVFMHSFTADRSHRGVTLPYIRLSVLRPETISSLITEVLQKQSNELWYLNQKGDQYYFSSVPNLNRMVIDKKSLVSSNAVRDELKRRIQRELGTGLRCYLWPEASEAVPDNQDLKLAVIDPEGPLDLHVLENWLSRRGSGFRVYKNTLFFALPDRGRNPFPECDQLHRGDAPTHGGACPSGTAGGGTRTRTRAWTRARPRTREAYRQRSISSADT